MPPPDHIFGFDFGTTNSLVALIQPGSRATGPAVTRFLDENRPIPSVVSYEGGEVEVGRRAQQRLSRAGLGVQGSIVRSPKTLLGRDDIHIDGVRRDPVQVVTHVLEHVRSFVLRTPAAKALALDRVVATIPVNMDGRRRALLRSAFRDAGMEVVQFVHEPLAALYGFFRSASDTADLIRRYDGKLLVVFDWGGGTLDLTLCRAKDGVLTQLANDGTEEVGGDIFDENLRNEVESRSLATRSEKLSTETTADARKRLLHQCEIAKIELSAKKTWTIFVDNYYLCDDQPDLVVSLRRDDLYSIVSALVRKGISRIERLLESSGMSTSSVDLCFAVGGMVNMPLIKSRLDEIFGPARVHVSSNSASAIADGAAWVAYDRARLTLAKNVELLLARNSYLPVLSAGFEMPYADNVHKERIDLFCVDPTDGVAKFVLMSPERPGRTVAANEPRRTLANMVLKVDSRTGPFKERLSLDMQVDENMILTAMGWSTNQNDRCSCEIHDLEFALRLPADFDPDAQMEEDGLGNGPAFRGTAGDITIRSNLADREDPKLVPGEVMRRFNENYFRKYIGHEPPAIQIEEDLYYRPCAYCGCASNDPRCACASRYKDTPGFQKTHR
jgi:molecular chaperone DnaK